MTVPLRLASLDEAPNVALDKPILLVGRSPDCDIVLDSRKISRQHCCLALVDSYLIARDLGSTNGIRRNGERVEEAKIQVGDELTIGNLRFRLEQRPKTAADDEHEPLEDYLRASRVTDSQLEKYDEPVPLAESGEIPTNRSGEEAAGPIPLAAESAGLPLAQGPVPEPADVEQPPLPEEPTEGRQPPADDESSSRDLAPVAEFERREEEDEERRTLALDEPPSGLMKLRITDSGWITAPRD